MLYCLGLVDAALFDEEVVDLARLVHVDLDEGPCLGQPQTALPPALVQKGLLVLQVGARDQPYHLAQLGAPGDGGKPRYDTGGALANQRATPNRPRWQYFPCDTPLNTPPPRPQRRCTSFSLSFSLSVPGSPVRLSGGALLRPDAVGEQ